MHGNNDIVFGKLPPEGGSLLTRIKDIISKIEKEVVEVECKIDELEKRMEHIHQRRILNAIRRGENNNVTNM